MKCQINMFVQEHCERGCVEGVGGREGTTPQNVDSGHKVTKPGRSASLNEINAMVSIN